MATFIISRKEQKPIMCDVLMTGLAVASTLASTYAQSEQKQATNRSNDQQKLNVMASRDGSITESINAVAENSAAASQRTDEVRKEALRQRATARVSAAEAGVSGLSVDALLRDLSGQEAGQTEAINTNLMRSNSDVERSMRNVNTRSNSTINGLQPGRNPDYLGSALTIGSTYQRSKQRNKV